jgi:hypothetical protein
MARASSRRAVGLDPDAGKAFWADGSSKKESSQMDHKIGGAAVAGALNLGNVLELVDLLFLARHGVTFPRFVSS